MFLHGDIFHPKVLRALCNFRFMFVHDTFCGTVNLLYRNARIPLLSSDAASIAVSFQGSAPQLVLPHIKFTMD